MANLSDAYGEVSIDKVGNEFKEFIKAVQGDTAYYQLVDDVDNIEVDNNGNAVFSFGACGRWNYESNVDGYLKGTWMNGEGDEKAYKKFIKAFKDKKATLTIEYEDSDPSMDWMGKGVFEMTVGEDGEIEFSHDFEEERVTIPGFANMHGETDRWALEYLYGDEVATEYDEYEEKTKKEGKEPVGPDDWYSEIYEEEV